MGWTTKIYECVYFIFEKIALSVALLYIITYTYKKIVLYWIIKIIILKVINYFWGEKEFKSTLSILGIKLGVL